VFEVQATLDTPDGLKRPDYVFYNDAAALSAHKNKTLSNDLLRGRSYAVGDAKAWDRALDKTQRKGGKSAGTLADNPSLQISYYMLHSSVAWGILTNGRHWRLYHKDSAHKLDVYYDVDLPALLARGDVESFLYFYAFFRRAAFAGGPLGLDALLRESTDDARAIGDSLKRQVYDALRHLAQGFLDYAPNDLEPDEATLSAIYDNALIVLYRLLFILYAEARGLLPVNENALYRDEYSLQALKDGVARDLDAGRTLLPSTARLWPTLLDLFNIVDKGSPPLHVATFNGGLFDPARHPFLARNVVGDAHVQQALDKLARVGGEAVDYRDLAERHLGTIYEGLLEYHLTIDEPERKDGREAGWTVVLENDKGQRHVTGSYYTPDDIVKYMIDDTLGPVLQRIGDEGDEGLASRVLALKVLDPAMGSGHFLVEATDYIARFLVRRDVHEGNEDGENDLAYWRRRVAQSCIYGVDLNPLAVDLAKLSLWLITVARDRPLSFLDHHLRAGNALVGLRTDELRRAPKTVRPKKAPARKASRPVSAEQLLMFGDDAFAREMSGAVGSMERIERSPNKTIADVKEQEALYTALREHVRAAYGVTANLETAVSFDLVVEPPALWPSLVDYASGRSLVGPSPRLKTDLDRILGAATAIAEAQRFFFWDLEFPEVFFDEDGQSKGDGAGFDVVVGNPPYVRQEALGGAKQYFQRAYPETYDGAADLYVYFYQRGLQVTRAGGRLSYIVTNKWLRSGYGESLRGYFAQERALVSIVDFGHAPIFADADVFPCIVVLEKQTRAAVIEGKQNITAQDADGLERHVATVSFRREAYGKVAIEDYVQDHSHDLPLSRFGAVPWSLETDNVEALMAKVRGAGVPLATFAGARPYYGVKTGFNEAFLIDTPTRDRLTALDPHPEKPSADIIKPYLRGRDIKRWTPEPQGEWIIFTRRGIDIEAFPAIKEHLSRFRERLEPKPRSWPTGSPWLGRQAGSQKWYEVEASIDYWRLFEQPKIIYPDITWRSQFAYSDGSTLLGDTAFLLPTMDLYVLAVLNSPLLWAYLWRNVAHGKDEALRMKSFYMETVPIAEPTAAVRREIEEATAELIVLSEKDRATQTLAADWLRTEFSINTLGQVLADIATLDADAFVAAVRKRQAKGAPTLGPLKLKQLRDGYHELTQPALHLRVEADVLEQRISDLVNQAYGLDPAEVALLWETAPPRMPSRRVHGAGEDTARVE